ncbi:MAG: hypothetical protein Q9184_007050 [Pyrenodesmia sp. 2 TL-2023]
MDAQVEAFVKEYGAQWSPPSTSDQAAGLGNRIASYYRPGMTFFINGNAIRLETQEDVTGLMTAEIQGAFEHGVAAGAELVMRDYRVDICSPTSAICQITFEFKPAKDGRCAGQDFEFTNYYGYRAEGAGVKAGWEFVIRDQEANEMGRAMGVGGN